MPVDYDLVIVGYTNAGVEAAKQAAQQRARVVLVAQNTQPQFLPHRAIAALTRSLHQVQQTNFLYKHPIEIPALNWEQVKRWTDLLAQDHLEANSPAILTASGVEFIAGSGEFVRKPGLGFVVNGRVLRSRSYLLTPGHHLHIPDIDGLSATDYLTSNQIIPPPKSLSIISSSATGAELAQLYARLGSQVTLISSQPEIVPDIDPEIGFLLQAQLETEGIRMLSGKPMQIRCIQDKKWVQVDHQAIEADEILLATDWRTNLDDLNLAAVGVSPLLVNSKLQTKNPRIYWAGSYDEAIAAHEVTIALKNALYFPWSKVNYSRVLHTTHTDPALTWIGPPASQAEKDVTAVSSGGCKLLVSKGGKVLGMHQIGEEQADAIALAIQHKIKLQNLSTPTTHRLSQRHQEAQEVLFGWLRAIARS
jgi:pyruvate/2-oxoglutarate dehydrogenase complex dihydrolipoamide dehydrogenase (E3) component